MAILDLGPVVGPDGVDGTDGTNGFSPTVYVAEETPDVYVLGINTVDGEKLTPNMHGPGAPRSNTVPIFLAAPTTHEAVKAPQYLLLNSEGAKLTAVILVAGEMTYKVIKTVSSLPYAQPSITALSAVWDDGETTITWNVPSNYVHHFTIRGSGGTFTVDGDRTEWTTAVFLGTSIEFTVTDIAGMTASQSIAVSGMAPPPLITNLTAAKASGAAQVHVQWNISSEFIDHYEITYAGATYNIAGSATSYDAAIADGVAISLKAIDVWGQQGTAAAQVVYLPPVPVINMFTAGNPTGTMAHISWGITSPYLASIGLSWLDQSVTLSPEATTFSVAIPVDTIVTLSATDSYEQTVTTTTVVQELAVIDPSAKDIGVKLGLTAPVSGHGYTPEIVTKIVQVVGKYATQDWLSGNFAVGDYFDLDTFATPLTIVKDAANTDMEVLAEGYTNAALTNADYTGYEQGTLLRFHIESVDGYYGKNGNNHHHLVFRSWARMYSTREGHFDHRGRMNNARTATGGWAASGAKRFLNGAFLEALATAGIPEECLMDTKRVVSTSMTEAAIDTSKIFLATEWEEFGVRALAPPVENDGTQIHFGTVPVGSSRAHLKSPFIGNIASTRGMQWLCSIGDDTTRFATAVPSAGSSAGNYLADGAAAYAPAFCVAFSGAS